MKYHGNFFFSTWALLIVFLFLGTNAFSQTFVLSKAEITVAGIAREKPWLMKAQQAESLADLVYTNGKLTGVQLLKFSVKVADLKSENPRMDLRAHKALKAYPHERIEFLGKVMKLTDIGPGKYMLLADGNLHIGGITQIASIPVTIQVNSDGTLTCTGAKEIRRSDFNVKLLPAEESVMRLEDDIQISFQLILARRGAQSSR